MKAAADHEDCHFSRTLSLFQKSFLICWFSLATAAPNLAAQINGGTILKATMPVGGKPMYSHA